MTCRINKIIFVPPEREEKKLSYLEWRDMMERRYDVMPRRYWRNPKEMYQEYLEDV
tara:strand:+ start:178 stop:345 length:168 start_codon:yes stop_codon:yes gene_type:complete